MTYLELCRWVVQRAGITGANSNKPDSVVGQIGRTALIVDMVDEAHRFIVSEYNDWSFRNIDCDLKVAPLESSVELPDNVERVNENSVYGRTNCEKIRLCSIGWPEMRRRQNMCEIKEVSHIPSLFSISPDGSMHFSEVSNEPFIVRSEVLLMPLVLNNDDDEFMIPEPYHHVIAYKALMLYHDYDEAPQPMQMAERNYAEWMDRLVHACLPNNSYGRTQSVEVPLAITTV